MWHNVGEIAHIYKLDKDDLKEFARKNQDRYHIAYFDSEPEVNTWNIDKMLKEYKQNVKMS